MGPTGPTEVAAGAGEMASQMTDDEPTEELSAVSEADTEKASLDYIPPGDMDTLGELMGHEMQHDDMVKETNVVADNHPMEEHAKKVESSDRSEGVGVETKYEPKPADDVVGGFAAAEKLPFEEEAVRLFGGRSLFGETTQSLDEAESLLSFGQGDPDACSSRSSQNLRRAGAMDPKDQMDDNTYQAKVLLLYQELEVAESRHSFAEVIRNQTRNFFTAPERARFFRESPQSQQFAAADD